ncbi:Protein transport Sec1a [Salvia divinorum]|uniref:Protein transport Sec1a n=1 Tax=Salvia divinorum TaxID=28513 RepID=A0ABD1GK43_SALDI
MSFSDSECSQAAEYKTLRMVSRDRKLLPPLLRYVPFSFPLCILHSAISRYCEMRNLKILRGLPHFDIGFWKEEHADFVAIAMPF